MSHTAPNCPHEPAHWAGCTVLRTQYMELLRKALPLMVEVYEMGQRSEMGSPNLLARLKNLGSIARAPKRAEELGWAIQDYAENNQDSRDPGGMQYELGNTLAGAGEFVRSRYPVNQREYDSLNDWVTETEQYCAKHRATA